MPKRALFDDGPLGRTDLKRWRLDSSDHGRHVWSYQQMAERDELGKPNPLIIPPKQDSNEQTAEEKYWLGMDTGAPELESPNGDPFHAARNGYEFFKQLQSPDGHWAGEYGGPLFLLPGMVITLYATQTPIPQEWKIEISRYLANVQRRGAPDDQGWGLHDEGPSTVYGTALNYVTLRLLGVDKDAPLMVKARATLHALGGASGIPSWGKAWLSILGVYQWDGMNAIPPELWLLPKWIPVHPWRWWCHTRAVYIPMGYIYGKKFVVPLDDLTRSLREEIYVEAYDSIYWPSCRNKVAKIDTFYPHTRLLDAFYLLMGGWEKFICPRVVREAGIREAYRLVVCDDENSNCQTIGPVSKAMNMLCRWIEEGPDGPGYKAHLETVRDFLWQSPSGMLMCGTNGSQAWDAGFAGQMLFETGLAELPENHLSAQKLLEWLDDCQMLEDTPHVETAHRHPSKGAWPFSTREQHWTVSDCTAEAMKAIMYLQSLDYIKERVSRQRLNWAVDVLLTMQNPNGGFATYELIRGTEYMELINPAEVFGNIMIEYNYPECTTAVLTALSIFSRSYPEYRRKEVQYAYFDEDD